MYQRNLYYTEFTLRHSRMSVGAPPANKQIQVRVYHYNDTDNPQQLLNELRHHYGHEWIWTSSNLHKVT